MDIRVSGGVDAGERDALTVDRAGGGRNHVGQIHQECVHVEQLIHRYQIRRVIEQRDIPIMMDDYLNGVLK